MRVIIRILVFSLIAAAVIAADEPRLPSITLPPELDRVLRDYERAWRAKDAAALAALFTEDGFVLSNGKGPVRGRAAIRGAYADGGGPLSLRALAYSISGTTGYIIGAYGGDAATDDGKFILAVRRGPGKKWFIAADMDNSNRRPGTPPPPSATRRDDMAIREVILGMARAADLHQWDTVRTAFAPEVELDYGAPERIAADEIVKRWQPLLSGFDWTRHELSGVKVTRDGERARVDSTFTATHFIAEAPGGDTWVLKGRYEHELAKSPSGWTIVRMKMIPGESTGNPKLIDLAKSRSIPGSSP
jgi:ketosteroid isomerase-like protein